MTEQLRDPESGCCFQLDSAYSNVDVESVHIDNNQSICH